MNDRKKILSEVQKYFVISELVCPQVLQKYGEKAWQFLDTDALHVLLILRTKILNVPLTCNTRTATQRGLRCNLCTIPKGKTDAGQVYESAHVLGKAFDLLSPQMSAAEMRRRIAEKADLLPCNVRIEGGVSWLHIDVYDTGQKVYIFSV